MDNDNKPVYKKDSIFSPNKTVAIIAYVLALFVLSSLVTYILAYLYSSIKNISYNEIIDSITNTNPDIVFSDSVLRGNSIVQGLGNMIVYLVAIVFVVFYMRDDIATDFKDLKANSKFNLWYLPVTAISFVAIAYGIDELMQKIVPESNNQQTIVNIMTSGGAVPMIIATVLLAPVVEELIYRKCIFHYFKKYGIVACYIASILLFTLPHMLSTVSDIRIWLLQCIPYAASGFLLCLIYHKSKYNIYSAILAHMANNLLAVILVYIS